MLTKTRVDSEGCVCVLLSFPGTVRCEQNFQMSDGDGSDLWGFCSGRRATLFEGLATAVPSTSSPPQPVPFFCAKNTRSDEEYEVVTKGKKGGDKEKAADKSAVTAASPKAADKKEADAGKPEA